MTPCSSPFFRRCRCAIAVLLLLLTAGGLWLAFRPGGELVLAETGQAGKVTPLPAAPQSKAGTDVSASSLPGPAEVREGAPAEPLPETGRLSLDDAMAEALHRVMPLTEDLAQLPGNAGVSHFAANPGQDITARFLLDGGVKFESGKAGKSWQGTLAFAGGAGTGAWQAAGHRMERGAGEGIVEWYENKPEGIEHGFTLTKRPAGAGDDGEGAGLSLSLDGLRAEADPARPTDLRFVDPATGQAVLGYQKLIVSDASGKELASRMEPSAGGVLIAWQDAGAEYPVTVDPLVVSFEQAMDDPAGAANDYGGLHAALDGDTAVIGALNDDTPAGTNAGSILIFRRAGTVWSLEAKVLDPAGAANDRFGVSVGISGDTVIVGSDFDDENGLTDCGSASIFVRSGTTWLRQGAKLVPGGANSSNGRAVAIDGNIVVIGGPGAVTNSGRAWVYVRTGTAWTIEANLQAATVQSNANFGFSVDLRGDRIIVGEPRRSSTVGGLGLVNNHGQATIFHRSGTAWTRQATLVPGNPESGEQAGFAVAIHGDLAVMGAPGTPPGWTGASPAHANSRGRAFYSRYSATWPAAAVIPGPALTDGAYYGFAVDVQGDVVAVAGIGMDGTRGQVHLRSYRAGGTWAIHPVVQPAGLSPVAWFGTGVSISGNYLLAGAHGSGTANAGRAFVFNVNPVEDASINVSSASVAVGMPPAASLVAIRSVPGKEGFRIPVGGSLQRWDALDVPLPVPAPADGNYFPATFDVNFRVVLHNETDNVNVPLQNGGTITESITAPAFVLNGSLRNPFLIPVARTLHAVPVNETAIMPNKSYRFTVTVSHQDGATEVTDVTRTLSAQKLLSLSGQLKFGNVDTALTAVTGNPAAGPISPRNTANTIFSMQLTIPAGGAYPVTAPARVFGGGPLTVFFFGEGGSPHGNLVLVGTDTVQLAASGAGTSAGVRWSHGPLVLTENGAVAQNFLVKLPSGLGYANYAADRVTRMKGSAIVNVPLTPLFEPTGIASITGPVGLIYVTHERLPAWMVATRLDWDIAAGTFTGVPAAGLGNISAVHFRAGETTTLLQTAAATPLADGDNGTRMTNDGYFGRGIASGNGLVVRVSPEGRALLDYTYQIEQPGFQAHFPKGLTVPAGQTIITYQNSQVVSGTMTQTSATPATLTYATSASTTPACATTNPALNQRTVSFTNPGNVWQVTADNGLRAEGSITTADVAWGIRPDGRMVHTLKNVSTGVMHLAGTALSASVYGAVPNDGAGYLPAAMLLTGHGSPSNPALVERPFRAGYDPATAANAEEFQQTGSADYPGFNIRAASGGGLNAVSWLCNSQVGQYSLKAHSKYYLRRNGVTGVHDAVTSSLNLPAGLFYGYDMSVDGLRLAYLDNENTGSAVSGAMQTGGPTKLALNFKELLFSSTGQLRNAELNNPGPKTLDYWNTRIDVHSMEFASVNACNMAQAPLLALSVTGKIPAITDDPLQARLGIHPDGNLATAATSGDSGIDSRFTLPQTIQLKGGGGGFYTLTPVTRAVLNNPSAAQAGPIGFVSFAGALAVPFFEDIPVHVHTTASEAGTPTSELHLMAGGGYFSDPNFDNANRGFLGTDLAAYRNGLDPQYLPVARRNWRGIAELNYPLKWQSTARQFASPAGMDDTDTLLVLEVKHQVQKLTTTGTAITFGTGFETPQLSVAALAAEALTSGLKNALPSPDAMLSGIDGLETLLTDRLERAISTVLNQRLDSLANSIVGDLQSAYQSVDTAGAGWTGFSALGTNFTNRGAIEAVITDLAKPKAGNGPIGVLDQIDSALAGADQACDLAIALVGQPGNRASVVSAVLALSNNLPSGPISGVGTEVMDQAEDGLRQAQLILAEAKTRIGQLRSGVQQGVILARLNSKFQQAASTSATAAINQLVATYKNENDVTGRYWGEFTTAQHKARVLGILRQSMTGSSLAAEVQPVLRGVLTEVRSQFRGALDLVFSEINRLLNRAVKGMVDELVAAGTSEFKELAGSNGDAGAVAGGAASVGNFCAAARIDGYAQINGEEIEEIRLNARLKFNLAAALAVDGWFHLKNLNGAPPTMSCREAGVVGTEVKIGANAAADFGPAFKVAVTMEGIFSFAAPRPDQPGNPFPLLALDGSFDLRSAMPVKQASITHMAAKFGFGGGVGFVSGQIEGTVYAIGTNGRCFFGTTNNFMDFSLIDPQTLAVLQQPPIIFILGKPIPPGGSLCMPDNLTGFYVSLDLDGSVNQIFGIPDTCFLRITGHIGVGNYCFYQDRQGNGKYLIPGVRYRVGLSGEVLCTVELSAIASLSAAAEIPVTNLDQVFSNPTSFLGDLSNATARGVGDIEFKAKVGLGPVSVSVSKTVRFIIQLSKDDVDVSFN